MNIFLQSMRRIKSFFVYTVMHKVSVVSLAIFIVGALCAGGVLYVFAFTTPLPPAGSQIVVRSSVTVLKPSIANVQKYASLKKQSAGEVPAISSVVFYVPPSTP